MCTVGGLAKIYGLMALAVCLYLAVDRGLWQVIPVATGVLLITVIGGRLLWRSMRGSRRGSLWPPIASVVTWLMLVTVVVVAGVFLVAIDGGAL